MSEFERRDDDIAVADFAVDYARYLADVQGLAFNSCRLHNRVTGDLLARSFPSGRIHWPHLTFSSVADFLISEFARLPNHWTQGAWLMAVRNLIRYLESEGNIAKGWGDLLPGRTAHKHAALPRCFSPEEMQALRNACQKKTHRHLRDRALLLVYNGLALRTQEVADVTLTDIDWHQGKILIRSTKTRRERTLPLAQDVGDALIEHIRARLQNSPQVFAPRYPPYSAQRCLNHVRNSMSALFRRAGLPHCRLHSLRHTAATGMVNHGATFKDVSDVLGHRCLSTTLIYAKLDMQSLAKVCLPWPGGGAQ